jgi:ABC-type Fe3+/spermidine/putrescine transport system ATPase subunit
MAIRPEDLRVVSGETGAAESALEGTVRLRAYMGDRWEYRVGVGGAEVRVRTAKNLSLEEGATVRLMVDEAVVLPPGEAAPEDPVWHRRRV